ncbi:MAG: hypothetical protein ACFFE2_11045 [Candidatus Thorarchaeota archaeon]
MKQLRNAPRVLAVVVAMMVLLSSLQTGVHAQGDLDPILVLYDASHNPQHDALNAENGLKLILDAVNSSTRYMVRINTDELTETVLNDVDALIIASPDENSPFEIGEVNAIAEMLANGSSLFLLGDPTISQTTGYWADALMQDMGETQALNTLLDDLNITGVRFSVNQTTTADIYGDTMFDYDNPIFNETYPWMVELDPTTWETNHPIFRNINELFTMTSTLKPIDLSSAIAKSYESTFAQFKAGPNSWANYSHPNMTISDFEEVPLSYSAINGTFPSWMSAFEYEGSRVVIVGSTLMFTGRHLDFPETDLRWFYMGDNSRLFMNIINWLTEGFVAAPSAIVPMLVISTVVLVIGLAFYIFKKIR